LRNKYFDVAGGPERARDYDEQVVHARVLEALVRPMSVVVPALWCIAKRLLMTVCLGGFMISLSAAKVLTGDIGEYR
jgi:hypothetical protein